MVFRTVLNCDLHVSLEKQGFLACKMQTGALYAMHDLSHCCFKIAGAFKETVVKVYCRQILLGLEYLHKNHIMHRDIKGANILVDNAGRVKLADFGASKQIEDLVTIGTPALVPSLLFTLSTPFILR